MKKKTSETSRKETAVIKRFQEILSSNPKWPRNDWYATNNNKDEIPIAL